MPPAFDEIEQLDSCKLFGVIFQSKLKMDANFHFDTVCTAYVFTRVVKSSGYDLYSFGRSTVIAYFVIKSLILSAIIVWGEVLSSELVAEIDAFVKRRNALMTRIITIAELMKDADRMLFKQVCLPNLLFIHHYPFLFALLST